MMCAVCMFDGRRQADQIEQLQQDLAAAQEEAQYRGFRVRDLLPYQERAVTADSDLAAELAALPERIGTCVRNVLPRVLVSTELNYHCAASAVGYLLKLLDITKWPNCRIQYFI